MLVSVLLVEDDPEYGALVKFALSQSRRLVEFNLHWVPSLSEATDLLRLSRVDVVLLDLGLPDSEGISIVAKIQALAPESAVIVLSAEDGDASMWEAIRNGAQDHIPKFDLRPLGLPVLIINAIARNLEQLDERRCVNAPNYPVKLGCALSPMQNA